MKPSTLASLFIRLVSMALMVYGSYQVVAGFVGLRAISKQVAAFEAARGDTASGVFKDVVHGLHASAFAPGVAAWVIAIVLLLSSRRLGERVARGL